MSPTPTPTGRTRPSEPAVTLLEPLLELLNGRIVLLDSMLVTA